MGLKESYQHKMDIQLNEWHAKIDILKAKADEAEAEQKVKYYKEIEALLTKQQQVKEKLNELQYASESAWEDIKNGVELAREDLKESVYKAVEKFK